MSKAPKAPKAALPTCEVCEKTLSRHGVRFCRQHANQAHGFGRHHSASEAALRRLALERAGKEALKREQAARVASPAAATRQRPQEGVSDGDEPNV